MGVQLPIQSYLKPKPTPSNWVRPSDWIVITDSANEVNFLVADTDLATFTINTTFTKNSGTNLYIDWGDGVTDTISTATSVFTNHTYTIGTGTSCSRGYTTFKIRVYTDATSVITVCNHVAPRASIVSGSIGYTLGLLEAYYGNNACTVTAPVFTSASSIGGVSSFQFLEYVKLPTTVTYTSITNMFYNCVRLFVVVMPTSGANLTTLASTFFGCLNLLDITLPSNATGITSLASTFSGCSSLRTVSFPTTLNSCTTFDSTFLTCVSLKNLTIPSNNLNITFNATFNGCIGLLWVKFNALPTPASPSTAVTASNMFLNCASLENVYFPSTCSANARYGMLSAFQSCSNLRTLIFPTNFDATSLSSTFLGCSAISLITFPNGFTACTTMANAFQNCFNLDTLTLPTTMGSNVDLNNAFNTCKSLTSITIPSGYNITSLQSTFGACDSLSTVVLPNNSQNNITSLSNTFNACYNLTTVTMPTSLTGVTLLQSAFANCYELQSVVFPATMNSVTTVSSIFSNCFSLTSVTMPTSMSACTNFSSIFSSCYKITSITLPATVAATTTTFASAFQYCTSVKTITLPTTQTTSLTTFASAFQYCGALTTITNLNKLGILTATPLVTGDLNTFLNLVTTMSYACPLSKLNVSGASATNFSLLNSLRLTNTSTGQWSGTSPQINVSFTSMSTANLNTLFADMAAQGAVTSKTINITSATGAAGLTAADRLVITSLGWTIIP
jgi:hypothetical protein